MIDFPPLAISETESVIQLDADYAEICRNQSENMVAGKQFLREKATIDSTGRKIWRADYVDSGGSTSNDVLIRVVCWFDENSNEPAIIIKVFEDPEPLAE